MKLSIKALTLASLLVGSSSISIAQSHTAAEINAMDPKARQLLAADPSTYQSDEPYGEKAELIQGKDILWRKRVWRRIDLTDPANAKLAKPTPGAPLTTMLLKEYLAGRIKAYSDDRFTQALNGDATSELLSNLKSTHPRFQPNEITSLSVKEDWIYLAAEHKMVVRIVGIAPLAKVADAKGAVKEQAIFWAYYPALRPYLSRVEIKKATGEMNTESVEQILGQRKFTSRITQIGTPVPNAL